MNFGRETEWISENWKQCPLTEHLSLREDVRSFATAQGLKFFFAECGGMSIRTAKEIFTMGAKVLNMKLKDFIILDEDKGET